LQAGSFTAPSSTLSLQGDFLHSGGTFSHNNGTLSLTGSSQTVSCAPSEGTTFYHLTKTSSSSSTLTFTAGRTCTIEGTLTLKGTSSSFLKLRSSSSGTQFTLAPQGSTALQYLDVKDSKILGITIDATDTSLYTNSGNNSGWTFNRAPSILSLSSPYQHTDGSGYLTFTLTYKDPDQDNLSLKIEFSPDEGNTWYKAQIASLSSSSASLSNSSTYQITSLPSSSSSSSLTITWNTLSSLSAYPLKGRFAHLRLRITPADPLTTGSPYTYTFSSLVLDNEAPRFPSSSSLSVSYSSSSSSFLLSWGAEGVTEESFSHYAVVWGEDYTAVNTWDTSSASLWNHDDDTNLALASTTTTTIPFSTLPSSTTTTYYFHLRAYDQYGNYSSLTLSSYTLNPSSLTATTSQTQEKTPSSPSSSLTPSTLKEEKPTIAQVLEKLKRGEIPFRTPAAFHLENLAKQARARRARQFQAFHRLFSILGLQTSSFSLFSSLPSSLNPQTYLASLSRSLASSPLFHKISLLLQKARDNRYRLALKTEQYLSSLLPSRYLYRFSSALQTLLALLQGKYRYPLAITGVTVSHPLSHQTLITWETSRPTWGKLNWGEDLSWDHFSLTNQEAPLKQHEVLLSNLKPSTTYYFEIIVKDPLTQEQTYDAFYKFVTPESSSW
jgi:hypothetical protein